MLNPADFVTHHHLTYWALAVIIRASVIFFGLYLVYWFGEHMSPGATDFWKGVLSDNGTASWSRVASSILLIACVAWDTLLTVRTNTLPGGGDLTAQALFMSSPYAINVTGKAVMQSMNKPSAPAPPPNTGDTTTVVVGK